MSAADLLPGFSERRITTRGVDIFARVAGTGPGLLLLHGYPQTHVMWHRVAGELARHFTVVMPDLRGYGRSSCPPSDENHRAYSKRVMALDAVAIMAALGFDRFGIMGHDRGARVAYRAAFDHPAHVSRLAVLDILPTPDQWEVREHSAAHPMFHWGFLAQPAPMPESLIGIDPLEWVTTRFLRGTKAATVDVIDPRAFAEYVTMMRNGDRLHATCEDFRAGARIDMADDEADRAAGRRIECPVLLLWGTHGSLIDVVDPIAIWRSWCSELTGGAIASGHFIPEENPKALLDAALPFLMRDLGGHP